MVGAFAEFFAIVITARAPTQRGSHCISSSATTLASLNNRMAECVGPLDKAGVTTEADGEVLPPPLSGSGSGEASSVAGHGPSLPPASEGMVHKATALPAMAVGDPLLHQIANLKAAQKRLRDEKKMISKNLRNAERRKKRLRVRAKQLTDDDLVAVLRMRQDLRERAAAGDGADLFSSPGASGSDARSSGSSSA